jgi:alkylation response protein AidB-like acyl-CoA dehydrogenase
MPGALNKSRPVVIPKTKARRDGNQWVLNGRKRWIGNAVDAIASSVAAGRLG